MSFEMHIKHKINGEPWSGSAPKTTQKWKLGSTSCAIKAHDHTKFCSDFKWDAHKWI